MDRIVNVRMYPVENRDGGVTFSAALRHIATQDLEAREYETEPEIVLRLERMTQRRGLMIGDIVRVQSRNLPPKAERGRPLSPLGVRSIGHSSAFAFDPNLSVLALETSRNGVTTSRIALYAEHLSGGTAYDILPVPDRDTLRALQEGNVRGISFRVATPNELREIDDTTRATKRAMVLMKNSLQPGQIDLSLSMRRGQNDIDRQQAIGFVGWLLREHEDNRGDVSHIRAKVAEEEGEAAVLLNLISGHLGEKRELDLPDDDPERNYELRSECVTAVMHRNRDLLAEMFGKQ